MVKKDIFAALFVTQFKECAQQGFDPLRREKGGKTGGVPGVSAPAHRLLEHPSHALSCLVGHGPHGSVECLRIFSRIFCCIPLASTWLSISMPFCKYLTPQMIFLPDLGFVRNLPNVCIICLRLYHLLNKNP